MPISPADRVSEDVNELLTTKGLTAGYGARPTVIDIDVCVRRGDVVSVVGPNGAGKSTLLKAIAGMITISAGSVTFDGRNTTGMALQEFVRLGAAYVPQHNDVFADLTVLENLEMGGYLLPTKEIPARVESVLDLFPALKGKLKRGAAKLSGGERKMVGIGRALMAHPSLVILDEPTAGLAPDLAAKLLQDDIRRLVSSGVGVLLVEQRAAAALEISEYAYVLVAGSKVLEGAPATLLARDDFGQIFLGQSVGPNAAL